MSEDRWATLSDLYGKMRQSFNDDHIRASQLAKVLRIQLSDFLGCSRDQVVLYEYDEHDHTYTPESNPFRAISMNGNYRWFLGFGVTLEVSPEAYPKTTFQFPIWFHLEDDSTSVDTSFGEFTLPKGDKANFSDACTAIYEGLKTSLMNRANRKHNDKKLGFLDFGVD